jgi:hypothetical protein
MHMTYVAIVAIFVLIVLLLDAALENREVDRSRQDRAGPDRPEQSRRDDGGQIRKWAPDAPSLRKARREAHMRGFLVPAVMIAALVGALAFVLLVRIG